MSESKNKKEEPLFTIEEDYDPDAFIDVVPFAKVGASHTEALQRCRDQFQRAYFHPPQFVARAPGRVTLLGGNIDGFAKAFGGAGSGVLGMALEQSIFCACSMKTSEEVNDKEVVLEMRSCSWNAEHRTYTYSIDGLREIIKNINTQPPFDNTVDSGDWSHHVLAAWFGVLEAHKFVTTKLNKQKLLLYFHGTIPPGIGVCSSSALVVAATVAFLTAFKQEDSFSKMLMASTCSQAEDRFLLPEMRGSGALSSAGVDQALMFFGEVNCARYIQFKPNFNHQSIRLPNIEGATWVICHTLESYKDDKEPHITKLQIGKRMMECQIGCLILAHELHQERNESSEPPPSLWELITQSSMTFAQLEQMVQEKIAEQYSKQELQALLITTAGDAADGGDNNNATTTLPVEELAAKLGIVNPEEIDIFRQEDSFLIRNRLLHVLSETRRVQDFIAICKKSASSTSKFSLKSKGSTSTVLEDFGSLMNKSHESSSQFYKNPHETSANKFRVDQLQQICRSGPGAFGARMTGTANSVVLTLVKAKNADAFRAHVRDQYYSQLPASMTSGYREESDFMLVTKPSHGTVVYTDKPAVMRQAEKNNWFSRFNPG